MLHETNAHTPDRLQNAAWIIETDTHAPGTVIDYKVLHETDAYTPDKLKTAASNWCLHTQYTEKSV